MSQHQQPVVCCVGDPGVSECTVQQWVFAEKTNSRQSLTCIITGLTAVQPVHARCDVGAKWLHVVLH